MTSERPRPERPAGRSAAAPAQPDPRRWWALVALSLAVLLVSADNTVLALAIPSLAQDLDPTPTELLWIGDSYSFVLAGLLITMGNVGDRWGRKRLLFIGLAGFGALSVVSAFAPTALALILARGAMGVAGATLMPSTLSILRNTFHEPKERRIAIGTWTAMGAVGAGLGPLMGGILLENFWWGSVFLINVPIVALVLLVGFWSLRESRNPHAGPLDLISVALSMAGLFAVVAAIKDLAISGAGSAAAWGIGGAGLVCLGLFVRRQLRLEHPLIDMRLFRIPAFAGAVVSDLLSALGLIGVYFFLSQKFQFVDGDSTLRSALQLLPGEIAAVIAAPVSAWIMTRFGRRPAICGGICFGGAGLVLAAFAPPNHVLWISGALVLVGFGFGLSLTGTSDAILASAPPQRAGAAAAVSETAYELGAAMGIAVLGTLLTASYRRVVDVPPGLSPQVEADLSDSISSAFMAAANLPANVASEVIGAAQVAFTHAFAVTCVAAAVLMFAAAVITFRVLPTRAEERAAPEH